MTVDPTTLAALTADPANRRRHGERNLALIGDALKEVGAARSIVIDEDNVILAGNGVTQAAAAAGVTKLRVIEANGDEIIAVRRRGLTEAQKRALALYDNRTAELAEWNVEQLFADQQAGLDLASYWDEAELSTLLSGVAPKAGLTDPDAVPEVRATDIQRGDLFELGAHRLLCGDATVAADVARVMGEDKAAVCVTDPPYAVNYTISFSKREGGKPIGRQGLYRETDHAGALLSRFLSLAPSFVVMSYPVDCHLFELAEALSSADFVAMRELVWLKDAPTFHPGATYQQAHEPILVCRRANTPYHAATPSTAKTILRCESPHIHTDHPTEKPNELWMTLLSWHSVMGDLVFEPFSGTGITILAAEQLGRACRAIEIEPQYCQVTLDRWAAFTGQTAQKVGAAIRE